MYEDRAGSGSRTRVGALTLPDPARGRRLRVRQPVYRGARVRGEAGPHDSLATLPGARHLCRRPTRTGSPAPGRRAHVLHLGSTSSPTAESRVAAVGDGLPRTDRASRRRRVRRRLPCRGPGGDRGSQQKARRLVRPAARVASERPRRRRLLPEARSERARSVGCLTDRLGALAGACRSVRACWRSRDLRRSEHRPSRPAGDRPGAPGARQPPARPHQ
jgi:hypothetical protein